MASWSMQWCAGGYESSVDRWRKYREQVQEAEEEEEEVARVKINNEIMWYLCSAGGRSSGVSWLETRQIPVRLFVIHCP